MLTLEKKGFRYEGWQLGDEVYYKKHNSSESYIKANIVGFQENNLSEFILIDCYDEFNTYSYNANVSNITSNEIIHYCETNKNQVIWVSPNEIELIKPYNDILRYKYIKFDENYIVKLTYQNFNVLERGTFHDEELNIISFDFPEYFKSGDITDNDCEIKIFILGNIIKKDKKPLIVPEDFFEDFKNRVRKLNEKFENSCLDINLELNDISNFIKSLKYEKSIDYINQIKQILNI